MGAGAQRNGGAGNARGDASAVCSATRSRGRGVLTESGLPTTSVNRFLRTFTRSFFAAVIFRDITCGKQLGRKEKRVPGEIIKLK